MSLSCDCGCSEAMNSCILIISHNKVLWKLWIPAPTSISSCTFNCFFAFRTKNSSNQHDDKYRQTEKQIANFQSLRFACAFLIRLYLHMSLCCPPPEQPHTFESCKKCIKLKNSICKSNASDDVLHTKVCIISSCLNSKVKTCITRL